MCSGYRNVCHLFVITCCQGPFSRGEREGWGVGVCSVPPPWEVDLITLRFIVFVEHFFFFLPFCASRFKHLRIGTHFHYRYFI